MTDWKPEKNISSPWDVDTWENNIGQPVKPSGDNLPYPYTTPPLKIGPSGYKLNPEKLAKAPQRIWSYFFGAFYFTEEFEYFDIVKPYLDIPEQPKTLEEISQEFDEKIDKLIEKTKRNFYASKLTAERNYENKFDRIIQDFEYAKEHGSFPQKLTYVTTGLGVNNYVTSNFVIKSTSMGVGYWDVKPNIQIWLQVKPNWLVRKCAKIFFDFGWKDG
jgi:hypothetical protein